RCPDVEKASHGGFGIPGIVPHEDTGAPFQVGEHQSRSQSTVTQAQHLTPVANAYAAGRGKRTSREKIAAAEFSDLVKSGGRGLRAAPAMSFATLRGAD